MGEAFLAFGTCDWVQTRICSCKIQRCCSGGKPKGSPYVNNQFSAGSIFRLNRNVWRWHDAQEQEILANLTLSCPLAGTVGSAGFQPACYFCLLVYFMQAGSLRYFSAKSAFLDISKRCKLQNVTVQATSPEPAGSNSDKVRYLSVSVMQPIRWSF